MPSQLHALLRHRLLVLLLAALLLYGLTGFFAVPALLRWHLPLLVQESIHCQATFGTIRINPFLFAVEIEDFHLRQDDGAPLVSFARLVVDLETSSLVHGVMVFRELVLDRPEVHLLIEADGTFNLEALIALPPPFQIKQGSAQGGKIFLADKRQVSPVELSLQDIGLQLRDVGTLSKRNGEVQLIATTPEQESLQAKAAGSLVPLSFRGSLHLKDLRAASLWQFIRDRLNLEQPEGQLDLATDFQLDGFDDDGMPQMSLAGLRLAASDLVLKLRQADSPLLRLKTVEMSVPRLDPLNPEVRIDRLLLSDGVVAARIDDQGAIDLVKIIKKTQEIPHQPTLQSALGAAADKISAASRKRVSAAAQDSKLRADAVDIKQLALELEDWSRTVPFRARVAGLDLHLRAGVELDGGKAAITLAQVRSALKGVQVVAVHAKEPLFAADRLTIEEGSLDTAAQTATVGRVLLDQGRIDVIREADSTFNWPRLFASKGTAPLPLVSRKPGAKAVIKPDPALKFLIRSVEIEGFSPRFIDLTTGSSAPVVSVHAVSAKVANIDGVSPMKVTASLQMEQGGAATLDGVVHPEAPALEADITLDKVVLASLQPYISQLTNLRLDSGSVSARGRLAYGLPQSRQLGLYAGSFSLNAFRMIDNESKKKVCSWQSLHLPEMQMTIQPNRLEAREVFLVRPESEVVIAADKTLNLVNVFKGQPDNSVKPRTRGRGKPASGSVIAQVSRQASATYQINKVRISDGNLSFADLSLRPRFITHIHRLAGTVTNLSSVKDSQAKVRLGGQVDQFGTATISGVLRPGDVGRSSNVTMHFRNLEMKNLSPYSGKYAGRLIKSGKISADLHYILQEYTVHGDNRLVIDNLTLGDKVEAPEATHLPLDLAVALLKDADGRIDIGLPVSGDMKNPEFSIGPLIWTMFTNLVTKVATAPFHALSGLMGDESVRYEALAFEPGSDELPPPEREKLFKVAEALKSRPQFRLTVQGRYSPEADGLELRERAVRREVAARLGKKPGPNEIPEPLDFTESGSRRALEKLYAARFGKNALEELDTAIAAGKVTPRPPPENKSRREPEPTFWTRMAAGLDVSRLIPGSRSPEQSLLWAGELYNRLVEQEKVNDATLLKLAERRGQIVMASAENPALIPRDRLELKSPEPFSGREPPAASLSLEAM